MRKCDETPSTLLSAVETEGDPALRLQCVNGGAAFAQSSRETWQPCRAEAGLGPNTAEELRCAIRSLTTSTQQNRHRTDVLEAQHHYAKHSANASNTTSDRRTSHVQVLGQKKAAELQHIKFTNEQLRDSLQEDVRTQMAEVERNLNNFSSMIQANFTTDDRVFEKLNSIASSNTEEQANVSALEIVKNRRARLTSALQKLRISTIKDRLDRTFAEAFSTNSDGEGFLDDNDTTRGSLGTELDTLYMEIDDMVTMTVACEFGSALDASLRYANLARIYQSQIISEEIHARICSLTKALEDFCIKAKDLRAHRHKSKQLEVQVMQTKDDALQCPPRPETSILRPSSTTDIAANALLRHLDLSTEISKLNEDNNLPHHLNELVERMDQVAGENIVQMLQTSTQAAAKTRNLSEAIWEVLATDDQSHASRHHLEQGVTQAKADMHNFSIR